MEDIGARIVAFILPLLPGFIAGYFLGRFAREALGTALLIAAGVAAAALAVAYFAGDVSLVADWLRTGSSWAGEKLSGFGQYVAALLPPIAALGIGFKIGLGRG
jgi:uncharacterized membrane protein (Fun14 family)